MEQVGEKKVKVVLWSKEAEVCANFVASCLFHRHRGVLDCDDKVILFGNDGYGGKDERAYREVELLKGRLDKTGITDYSFAHSTDEEHYSWAIVVPDYQRRLDREALQAWVWECWEKVFCGLGIASRS
jgi:hypothetical protein